MYISYFLFLLIVILFAINPSFFNSMYNSKLGRFILIVILIIIALNNLILAVILLIIIIVLSQNKKKVKPNPENSEIKKSSHSHKSKKRTGVNTTQVSEMFRPKSSKVMVVFPKINTETTPYSKGNFYEIKTF